MHDRLATFRLEGLVAATHTPMKSDGSIALELIPRQAEILQKQGVTGAFVCGSTGEGVSLTNHERKAITEAWSTVAHQAGLKLVVHVGHTSSAEAAELASHAVKTGADAVSTMAPFYFKPTSAKALVDWLRPVADACGEKPFYFYDIPVMTGVRVNMLELVRLASKEIPNFRGIKYTSDDLVQLQELLDYENGQLDILYGTDEALLAALALGVRGAVGSSYNFAAQIYIEIIQAFQQGDLPRARARQLDSVRLIRKVASYRYLPAAKKVMALLGCDCGPVRAPLENLSPAEIDSLQAEVKQLGLISKLV